MVRVADSVFSFQFFIWVVQMADGSFLMSTKNYNF